MPIDMSSLPRTAVEQWLSVVRLPLSAVAAVRHRSDDESWPPALAFDAFEARVKAAVASVLHDGKLAEAAELGEQRVARLRDAEERQLEESARESEELIETRARIAEQKRLRAERAALAERKKAVAAKRRALELEKATAATRQRRKATS